MDETMYDRIKRLRIERGMTQGELAKAVGYAGKEMISHIEAGHVDITRDKIVKFANALHVSPVYLLMGREGVNDIGTDITKVGPDEEHMRKYKMLDNEDKARIDERIEILLESDKYKKGSSDTA